MRRSSTDESTYHRSPSLDSKDYSFPNGAFRRYSSMYGGQFGAASNSFFGFHTNPGPKATKAKYTTPKGNKYVVFYLDLSFIFLLELKRCSMAHNCLQCIKYLMFVFNLLFWLAVMFYFVKLKEKHLCKKMGFLFACMVTEVLLAPPFLSTLL
ncbi:hypothetical protein TURU_143123 [Turdus rufiventris]|nr:hypothetical protein TURU_143123 [Turdus rufiventris]